MREIRARFAAFIVAALAVWLVVPTAFADDADRPGFDLPRGVVAGKLYRADTSEPIGRQWLTLKRRGWSRSGSTDTFGRFKFEHVPAGVYELSFYHSGYKVRTHGPIRIAEGQSIDSIDFAAVPVDAQVAPYTYSDTYLPGQNVSIMVRSIRVPSVNVEVFKFDRSDVAAKGSALLDYKRMTIPEGKKPMLTYRQPVTGGHQLRWRTTRVEPAFDGPGLYVVRVSGASSQKLIPLLVTQLSLVTKRTPDALWVWATDLESGRPLSGVNVVGEVRKAVGNTPETLLVTRKTDKRGLVKFEGGTGANLRFWGSNKEHMAYVDTTPPSRAQALAFRTYVYTDRPAYRPGDMVNFKVVARENRGGVYRVQPDEAWDVVVRDAEGQVVHEGRHQTNLFGTFAGELKVSSVPALGTWTIEARSGTRSQSGRFKVLEYRKPDYKLQLGSSQKIYVQGNTITINLEGRYYFGAPLKGRKVQWTAYETPFRPWWYDEYWGASDSGSTVGYGSVAKSGTVTLDKEGRATLEIDVDKASIDRWVTVEAVIADDSGRQVSARHKVTVSRGTFRLGLRGNGKIFKVGEKASFDIAAHRFDGKPAAQDLTVTASLETFSKTHKIWIYKTLSKTKLSTDGAGQAKYDFKVPRDGFIRLEVAGKDRYGNPVVESSFIWATRNQSIAGGYKKKSLDILADKKRYQPGETARVLINTTKADPWVLFTLEGDGVFEPQVVKVDGNSRLFEVKLAERHAPNVYFSVAFVGGKQFNSLQRSVAVSPKSKMLKLTVESDKPEYEPGQNATYRFEVRDQKDQPVQAELSVALVDEALYAISGELAPKIGAFFYGHRPNPVRTAHSFPSRYLGGADKDGEEDGDGVRRDFKDTAFWKAQVQTDAMGRAKVVVPLPDNLTTWRLTTRAVTKDTLVGHATHRIQTTKDLIATLSLPRFARRGDQIEVVTMVHNRGEDLSGVRATLTVSDSVTVMGDTSKTFDLSAGNSQALRWPVSLGSVSPTAKFTISVAAGSLSDAEERTIPLQAVMVQREEGVSGSTTRSVKSKFTVPTDAVQGATRLSLRLDSSLAASVMWSLEDLAQYPYGCVEQTMNSFLPDLVADGVLKGLGVQRSGKLAALPDMVRKGLSRLYEMQRSDGSFGWWTGDGMGDPYMTAYVVYGWARAKALGHPVKAHRLKRAVKAAIDLYDDVTEPETRAFLAYALSHTDASPERNAFLDKALPQLRELAPQLGAYSQAVIMLAHAASGKTGHLGTLAVNLRKAAVVSGDLAHFPGIAGRYYWVDNAHESTAYAIRALLAADAGDPLIESSVRWLMARRRGGMWDTTKDTAAAVEALVALAKSRNDAQSDYTAKVTINGKLVGTLVVSPTQAGFGKSLVLDVPNAALRNGDNDLAVEIAGSGTLYWTGALRFGAAPTHRTAGLEVSRSYGRIARRKTANGEMVTLVEPIGGTEVEVGEEIEVTLMLTADRTYRYVALEDLLPAGFEVVPGSSPSGFAGRTVRDDRVAFFARTLAKGTHKVTYRLRAETAGRISASPAVAWQMYMPEIGGNSAADTIAVRTAE